MSLRNRILIHGGLTALVLLILGVFMAEMAGLWVASQSGRDGLEQGEAITAAVSRRLPLALALGGFLFVLCGELLQNLWRRK